MKPPPGFERLLLGHAVAIARSDVAPAIRRAIISADGTRATLHEFAARHPQRRELRGRGLAYAVPLPQGAPAVRVVVRHNRHGGFFAPVTRDLFLAPTRAPRELMVSLSLRASGVRTPEVLAYVLYPPGGLLQRSDVCSVEIPGSRDLAWVLTHEDAPARTAALDATRHLLVSLARVGARHHDLNAKNVLLGADAAWVLDVDRVTLGGQGDPVLEANLARLSRSLRKWRDAGASVSEAEIAELTRGTRESLGRVSASG